MSHWRVVQWSTFARTWWLFDAAHQCPIKSSPLLVRYLVGKHKPIYHPFSDVGDHIVVINSRHVAMQDEKWRTHQYYHDTGYPSGKTYTRAWKIHEADPTKVLYKEIYVRMPKVNERKTMMKRLHIFPESDIPDDIRANITDQIRQIMPVPKRLDEYSPEERKTFPKLFDWDKDHVIYEGTRRLKEDDETYV
ncbi:large ribosomal subunit protein uL13m-like [Tubulanus polymorphus]|uniref:large ribosomal subunit protein uL13m-like n=1 Tax=Tubulanus polymorphus TaxID=672921 RepID=UPI003DA4206C